MTGEQSEQSPRIKLLRDVAILQLKLVADGFRDALLIPVSLIAATVGLLRGGDQPEREFRRVIKLGMRSERWINLFGYQRPLGRSHSARSLDDVLEQAEAAVTKKLRKDRSKEKGPEEEKKENL